MVVRRGGNESPPLLTRYKASSTSTGDKVGSTPKKGVGGNDYLPFHKWVGATNKSVRGFFILETALRVAWTLSRDDPLRLGKRVGKVD